MDLSDIDLNLLVIFQEVMNVRKVSKAAENLNLSQPAVSGALNRLRLALNDELFHRTSKGMKPTPLAEQLAEPVALALTTLKDAINQRPSFDSFNSQQTFTIATTDFGEAYLLTRLADKLRSQAPGVRIRSVRYQPHALKEKLESGEINAAIGLLPNLAAGYFQRRLFEHDYVILFRKDHPLADTQWTIENYMQAEHVLVESPDPGHCLAIGLLRKSGLDSQIRFYVSQFGSVPYILRHSDLVATVPRIVALAHQEDFNLHFAPHPMNLPRFTVNIFWHARFHRDPANEWLRGFLFTAQ